MLKFRTVVAVAALAAVALLAPSTAQAAAPSTLVGTQNSTQVLGWGGH